MMTFAQILILQIIAHLLADYSFQSHDMAQEKLTSGFKSKKLKWHILIVFILSWMLSFQWEFIVASALIASLHWVIDGLKKIITSKNQLAKYAFFIDQTLHLFVIIGSVFLFVQFFDVHTFIQLPINTHEFLIFLGFLLCTKPASIFIGEVLKVYNIQFSDKSPT